MEDDHPKNEGHPDRQCLNCHAGIFLQEQFCGLCGQKQVPLKQPLYNVLRQFFATFFQLDNRLWRTFGRLFIPGELTLEYFRGKRRSYIHPFRLFFFFLIVCFGLLAINAAELRVETGKTLFRSIETKQAKHEVINELKSALDTSGLRDLSSGQSEPIDSLLQQFLNRYSQSDSITVVALGGRNPYRVAIHDIATKSETELLEMYQVTGRAERLIFRQVFRLALRGDNFPQYLIRQSSWSVLLLMPVSALILKLLYFRRSRYFEEHLVFSLHTHTMLFFMLCLLMLATRLPSGIFYFILLSTLPGALLYGFVAMLRYYGQGPVKTLLKSIFFGFMYCWAFFFIFILTLLISIMLF